ncbi:MAG: TrkA family potassium uptake protein [Clostridia bacterium]|nr:TrkA family potassium uptake protein [Clostridia bacterium]
MKSILLIGLDNFGFMLAKELSELGHQIMAVDRNEDRINAILPFVTDAQIGDSTNETFLQSLGIGSFDVCIVTIADEFQSSLETTSLLKELGGRYVVSRANREVQAKFLLRNGADEVINPEKQMAQWAAICYSSTHILDYIKLDEEHAIFELTIPEDWVGKTVGQIDIRKQFGINIMAVKENGTVNLSITPETALDRDKTILVLGNLKAIQKCFHT